MAYVDYNYYVNTYGGNIITAENAARAFQTASDTVDTLTYCRIVGRGLAALTGFQKSIIERVVCTLAEWPTDKADMLDNPYRSYSVNGVSATWGAGASVKHIGDVLVPSSVYAELIKTGLCYPGVG